MADKPQKSTIEPRLPRGFADRRPAEIEATRQMVEKIREVYELYGFEPVETPFFEYTDALGKFLPDQDRPNEGVFSLKDDDDQWMSLRYDLTAPLARFVAQNYDALPKPYRSYRFGWVFRNEKPGPGRYRQFMQFDADTVGSGSVAADAEICMMAADTMERLGIPRGSYVVKVNNRKVLDGVMEAIGLAGPENAGRRLTVLRAIDKLDKIGVAGVQELLGAGRMDVSGDFTKGAGLSERAIEKVTGLLSYFAGVIPLGDVTNLGPKAGSDTERVHRFVSTDGKNVNYFIESNNFVLDDIEVKFGSNSTAQKGVEELKQIALLCESAGYGRDRIRIDPSVVRGLEYYTGPVYEVELTFEVKDEDGRPVRFGSVAGGGRYDGLVGRFRTEEVPATGFSIGVSRLAAALQLLGSEKRSTRNQDPIIITVEDRNRIGEYRAAVDQLQALGVRAELKFESAATARGPVVVTVMDKDRVADYQAMVARLRAAGIRAELYLGSAGFKAQMKYADRRESPCVIIQGGDEKAKGEVQIKNLALGAELAAAGAGMERTLYLEKQAKAQFAVPEAELVTAVKALLAGT